MLGNCHSLRALLKIAWGPRRLDVFLQDRGNPCTQCPTQHAVGDPYAFLETLLFLHVLFHILFAIFLTFKFVVLLHDLICLLKKSVSCEFGTFRTKPILEVECSTCPVLPDSDFEKGLAPYIGVSNDKPKLNLCLTTQTN